MNQLAPAKPNSIGDKKRKKRVITEARKIQNREAQRAYRLRQKELRAQREAQGQDQDHSQSSRRRSRSKFSAYHELRPRPPARQSPGPLSPAADVSESVSNLGADVPVQGDDEIISPRAHELNLTTAAGDSFVTPSGSIGDPKPPSVLGLVDADADMQFDPLSGLDFFSQASDINSHIPSIDNFLGPIDESLLLSFRQDSSNINLAGFSFDNTAETQPTPDILNAHPAPTVNSHDPNQTTQSASTFSPTTKFQPSSTLLSPQSNTLTPLATFFLTGTLQNAQCLGMSIAQFFSLNCMSLGSPFYHPTITASTNPKSLLASIIAANPFIPTHLRPTLPQILIQHHPLFDLIPLAGLRSRAIILSATMPGLVDMAELKMDIVSGGLVCRGGVREVIGRGGTGDPWDLKSWEVKPWFWDKWRLLLDGEGGDLWG